MILHILGNTVKDLSAADLITLNHLFDKYDQSGERRMSLLAFHRLCLDLVKANFVFNGPESLDTVSITQLHVLLSHRWKRRKMEEDGELDTRAAALDNIGNEEEEEEEGEELYRVTRSQRHRLQEHMSFLKSVCRQHIKDSALALRAEALRYENKVTSSSFIGKDPCIKVNSDLLTLMVRSIDADDYTKELIEVTQEHKKALHTVFEEARHRDQLAGREHASSPQVCSKSAREILRFLFLHCLPVKRVPLTLDWNGARPLRSTPPSSTVSVTTPYCGRSCWSR